MPQHHRRTQRRTRSVVQLAVVVLFAVATFVIVGLKSGQGATPTSTSPAPPASTTTSSAPSVSSSGGSRQASRWRQLDDRVRSVARPRADEVEVAIDNLSDGSVWTYGASRPQSEASIVKVDILSTLLARLSAAGRTPSSAQLALAESMIRESDNDSATALWNEDDGATGIAAFNSHIGMRETVPSKCVQCPGFPWPGWGLTTTTPRDQIRLLEAIVSAHGGLTPTDSDLVLHLMETVIPADRWGASSGVPSHVTVALKNGWLPLVAPDSDWQINSIAWVHGKGRDYLIAMMSAHNPTEGYGIQTLNEISSVVWSEMSPL